MATASATEAAAVSCFNAAAQESSLAACGLSSRHSRHLHSMLEVTRPCHHQEALSTAGPEGIHRRELVKMPCALAKKQNRNGLMLYSG